MCGSAVEHFNLRLPDSRPGRHSLKMEESLGDALALLKRGNCTKKFNKGKVQDEDTVEIGRGNWSKWEEEKEINAGLVVNLQSFNSMTDP